MPKGPRVFLSYYRADKERAVNLERALCQRGLHVWRDERSISAGESWSEAIERGIRESRGVAVLLTPASLDSAWVTYEYAFATGAGIPVVAVATRGTKVPSPIQKFQVVRYAKVREVAEKIDSGLRKQSRATGQERASSPKLVAKFQEVNGVVCRASNGTPPELHMDLWVEHAPRKTQSVSFEIPDLAFRDREWTIKRKKQPRDLLREFLTDDMKSYGDVEIWAYGVLPRGGSWSTSSTLYEALMRYYRSHPSSAEIRGALSQIKKH